VEVVEFGALSLREWIDLTGRAREAFGQTTARLTFRPKDHHVGLRDSDGRLIAVAGATIASVEVEGSERFDVVGIGALIVRADMRGNGLARPVMDAVSTLAMRLGPDRAMIFCEPETMALHVTRGYAPISAPVWADQPDGRIEMPLAAMWRALRPSEWPAGTVNLDGLPF
jgi:GNAT superfamily N-acetyltransferase